MLRFVGADASGHDVHVPLETVRELLGQGMLLASGEEEHGLPQAA
jgi:hypothetical protein